jgi:hypothetical protein
MSVGGGFFGGGGKEIKQDSHAVDSRMFTESGLVSGNASLSNVGSGKNSNVNLSIVSSDYGAIGAALNLTEKTLAASSALSADGISMAAKSLNDSANLAYDGLTAAGSVAQRGLDNSASLAYDGLSTSANLSKSVFDNTINFAADTFSGALNLVKGATDGAANLAYDGLNKGYGFATDVLNFGGVQNLEMLGKVENFSELAANHWLESAKLSDSQARYAMDYTAKENEANRVMLSDANAMVGNAYLNANQGLLALADVSMDRFATMQNEATNAISKYAESAQGASLKALDMVFESTKSPDERTIGDTTKWLIGGAVVVAAVIFLAPAMKG